MGLDGTIKRVDGKPLGPVSIVQQALVETFPGVSIGRSPSGAEKIKAAADQGIFFPEVLRQHMESALAHVNGNYESSEFSAEFNLGSSEIVEQVDVVLYGKTVASEPMFAQLKSKYGWITTHP